MLKFDTMVHVASSGTPGQRNFESPLPVKFKMEDGAQSFNL